MNCGKKKDNDKDCNCLIKIEDSLVIIICDEIDHKKLKDSLKDTKAVFSFEDIAKMINNR